MGMWDHSTTLPMYLVDTLRSSDTNRLVVPSLQTFYGRQPSFSGCRRQDLERTAGQSRLDKVMTVFPAPFEDIFLPAVCSGPSSSLIYL